MWKIRAPDSRLTALLVLAAGAWLWQAEARTTRYPALPAVRQSARGANLFLIFPQDVEAFALSPNAHALAAAVAGWSRRRIRCEPDPEEATLALWDVAGRRAAVLAAMRVDGAVEALTFSPDGRHLVATCWETAKSPSTRRLRVFAVPSGRQEALLPREGAYRLSQRDPYFCTVAFSADGRTLAVPEPGPIAGGIALYDTATWRRRRLVGYLPDAIDECAVALSPDGSLLAAGMMNSRPWHPVASVMLRSAVTGRKATAPCETEGWMPLFFVAGGKRVFCTCDLLEWRGRAVRRTLLTDGSARCVGPASPDGRLAYFTTDAGDLQLRELPANRVRCRWHLGPKETWPPVLGAGIAAYETGDRLGIELCQLK